MEDRLILDAKIIWQCYILFAPSTKDLSPSTATGRSRSLLPSTCDDLTRCLVLKMLSKSLFRITEKESVSSRRRIWPRSPFLPHSQQQKRRLRILRKGSPGRFLAAGLCPSTSLLSPARALRLHPGYGAEIAASKAALR